MKIINRKVYTLDEMTQDELNELALERNTLVAENSKLKNKNKNLIQTLNKIEKFLRSSYEISTYTKEICFDYESVGYLLLMIQNTKEE